MIRCTLVAGTDTGVGKTVAAAALAVAAAAAGHRTLVVKPVQTGLVPGEPGDADEVRRLSGIDSHELVRLPEALAPESAAHRSGDSLPAVDVLAGRTAGLVRTAAAGHVLVEGSGGVAVRLDPAGGTLLDLGRALEWHLDECTTDVVLVVRPGLGTLNHTELTLAAIARAGLAVRGLVIGCWPAEPGPADLVGREDLPRLTGLPLLALLPAGAATVPVAEFRDEAPKWFATAPWGGPDSGS